MPYYDNNDHHDVADYDSNASIDIEQLKSLDRGYTFVFRKYTRPDGRIKNKKIELYATGDTGSRIRDAVSGRYYSEKAGTFAENLYFKVGLSTGECKSKNGSNTLFFISAEEYEKHLYCTVSDTIKNDWLSKKHGYLQTLKAVTKK